MKARGFTLQEAMAEAWRCLDCTDAPCSKACPAGVDAAGFIRKIRMDNVHGAARLIRSANVLGETCAHACPVEEMCEGACRNTEISHPVSVSRLQEFACRWSRTSGAEPAEKPHPDRFEKSLPVAVIGAGPAGLACAAELARIGHRPVVFERESVPGGVPAWQIPEDRAPAEVLDAEVERVASLGVSIRTGTELGRDFSIESLLAEGFSAVAVCVGLPSSVPTRTKADQGVEVIPASFFLKSFRAGKPLRVGGKVAVIGGGNVAMDAACRAKEAGAQDVYVIYRRTFGEMPAWKRELSRALGLGVNVLILAQPAEYVSSPDGVDIMLLRTVPGPADASGRRKPVPVEGSQFPLAVNDVIEAVGQELGRSNEAALWGVNVERGLVAADPETGVTSKAGVFAAGDAVNGGATVAQAVGEGRRLGMAIARYLETC